MYYSFSQSRKWKMGMFERELLLEGPILDFNDHGRKCIHVFFQFCNIHAFVKRVVQPPARFFGDHFRKFHKWIPKKWPFLNGDTFYKAHHFRDIHSSFFFQGVSLSSPCQPKPDVHIQGRPLLRNKGLNKTLLGEISNQKIFSNKNINLPIG